MDDAEVPARADISVTGIAAAARAARIASMVAAHRSDPNLRARTGHPRCTPRRGASSKQTRGLQRSGGEADTHRVGDAVRGFHR